MSSDGNFLHFCTDFDHIIERQLRKYLLQYMYMFEHGTVYISDSWALKILVEVKTLNECKDG